MDKPATPWWKKPWVWFAGAASVLGGILVFVLTFGKKGGGRVMRPKGLDDKPPARPELPDEPKIQKAPDVSTTPKDDYDEAAKKVDEKEGGDVVDDLNARFK